MDEETLEPMGSMPMDVHAPPGAILFTAIAAIIISFLGFLGNLLTILALPYSRRLRNSATWLVVNLAVAEGVFCVTILPMSAAHLLTLYATTKPLFSDNGCRVFVFLRYVNIYAELFSIAAIAVNRCVLIAIPKLYSRIFTNVKTVIIIATIWIVSILLMLIPLLEVYGRFTYNHKTDECDFSDSTDAGPTPRKIFLAIGFLLPCIVIIASYSYIFYKARQSSAKIRAQTQNNALLNSAKESRKASADAGSRPSRPVEGLRSRDIRIARTIGVIFLVFLLCCLPVSIAHYFDNKIHLPTTLLLLHPVYWAQYCLNIVIYVFMNNQYRDAYVNYISSWWPNFREISRRKFSWKEEATSEQRNSRATTPNSVVRFATRKNSKQSSIRSPQEPPPQTPKSVLKSSAPQDTHL